MRKSQIARSSDLPATFSLAKYAPVKDFGIADWVVNLEMRVLNAFILSRKRSYPDADFAPLDFTEAIFSNPIWPSEKFKDKPGLTKHIDVRSVADMTVSDYFFGGSEFHPQGFKPYFEAFTRSLNSTHERDGILDTPLWKAYEDSCIDDDRNVFVEIDLHASEEKIVSDFREWLTSIRAQRQIKVPSKSLSENDFRSWHAYRLLPYLDLSNWAAARGVQITQQVIGAALFPDEYDISLAERIRKVVAPLAREVAHESFCNALRSQALAELAEQNSTKVIPGKWDNIIVTDKGWMPIMPD